MRGNAATQHDATWRNLRSFGPLLCPWIYGYPIPWPIRRLQKTTAVNATLSPCRLNTTGIRNQNEYTNRTPLIALVTCWSAAWRHTMWAKSCATFYRTERMDQLGTMNSRAIWCVCWNFNSSSWKHGGICSFDGHWTIESDDWKIVLHLGVVSILILNYSLRPINSSHTADPN